MPLHRKLAALALAALVVLAAGCSDAAQRPAVPTPDPWADVLEDLPDPGEWKQPPESPSPGSSPASSSGSVFVPDTEPSFDGLATPAPTAAPTPAPTPEPVSSDSVFFPDPALFLGREPDTSDSRRDGQYLDFQKIPIEQGQIAFAEFAELLQESRYQLELTNTFVDDRADATYSDSFDFTYVGTNPDVTQAYNSSKTNYYNVHLFLVCYTKTGNSSLGIHFSSGFTLEDPGVYTSADIPDSSPGSGGGSGSGGVPDWDPNIPEFARQDCLTCGGSGNCTRCGGSGYTYNDDIKSSCRSCHGSGDCSSCGGTGKR